MHLLEEVFTQASRLVLQNEAPVRFHIGQTGQEASVGVFVGVQALAAEEGVGVSAGNGDGKAAVLVAAQGFVVGVQTAQEAIEDGRCVVVATRNLLQ